MSDNGRRAVLYARTSYDDRDTDGRGVVGYLTQTSGPAFDR